MDAPEQSILPPFLVELERLIGLKATLDLVGAFGGCEDIYVPLQPSETSPVVAAIGMEAAKKLATEYGGDQICVPRFVARKAQAIARAQGTNNSIAQRLNCTARYVRKVKNAGNDPRQPKLFDKR